MGRRRIDRGGDEDRPQRAARTPSVTIPHDAANEAVVVAAMASSPEILADAIRRVRPDQMLVRENVEAVTALFEIHRRGLRYDPVVVEKVGSADTASYIASLLDARPEPPENLGWHFATLFWDAARASAARGPVPAFLEALRDHKTEPARVRALARQVGSAFDGHDERKYLHDPSTLVREQMGEIEKRVAGHASYPYGIPGLDYYNPNDPAEDRRKRMVVGAAPGGITLVTGVSGAGKSTVTANVVLGLIGEGRRVLYGAWEMSGGITLELLSCISLGWSRSEMAEGRGFVATHEGRVMLEERMHEVGKVVRFMGNPFRRQKSEQKITNDHNLDLVQGYIADSGCDVFVADLWKRCLREADPEKEEEALLRQQSMAEEERVHVIIVQQQRLKDVEMSASKKPTREGIKGSSAYVEVADVIIAPHRPALWKRVEDDKIELMILKQRYGKWPLAIEFDWDADRGIIKGGTPIDYERPGEGNEFDMTIGMGDVGGYGARFGGGRGKRGRGR